MSHTVPTVEVAYSLGQPDVEGTYQVRATLWLDADVLMEDKDWDELSFAWEMNLQNTTKVEIADNWAFSVTKQDVESAFRTSIAGSTRAWIKQNLPFVNTSELVCVELPSDGFDEYKGRGSDGVRRLKHPADWSVRNPLFECDSRCNDTILQAESLNRTDSQEDLLATYDRVRTDLASCDPETRTRHLNTLRDSIAAHTTGKLDSWKSEHPHWKQHAKERMKAAARTTALIGGGTVLAGAVPLLTASLFLCSVM